MKKQILSKLVLATVMAVSVCGVSFAATNTVLGDNASTTADNANAPTVTKGTDTSVAIGYYASATSTGGVDKNAVAVGSYSSAKGEGSVAVGNSSLAAGRMSIAIGTDSYASSEDGISLGSMSFANNKDDVALGSYSTTATPVSTSSVTVGGNTYDVAGSTASATVSVGVSDVTNSSWTTYSKSSTLYRTITNVAAGRVDSTSTDAVNGSELYATNQAVNTNAANIATNTTNIATNATDIAGLKTQMGNYGSQLNHLGKDINKVGAMSGALANLHPLDFDPDSKLSFAMGAGFYKNEKAGAIGMFYRPNEDTQFNVSTAIGNSDNIYGFGATFKVGMGKDSKLYNQYKTAPISTVYVLEHKISEDEAHIASQDQQIQELKAAIQQLQNK